MSSETSRDLAARWAPTDPEQAAIAKANMPQWFADLMDAPRGKYAIRCFGWFTPGDADVEGYNAWDYLITITEHSRFDTAEAAEAALKAEYKGADRDGVEPVLAVAEVTDEDA